MYRFHDSLIIRLTIILGIIKIQILLIKFIKQNYERYLILIIVSCLEIMVSRKKRNFFLLVELFDSKTLLLKHNDKTFIEMNSK